MIVVADSGPLIYLAAVSHFKLLRLYFTELLLPEPVYQEVLDLKRALCDRSVSISIYLNSTGSSNTKGTKITKALAQVDLRSPRIAPRRVAGT